MTSFETTPRYNVTLLAPTEPLHPSKPKTRAKRRDQRTAAPIAVGQESYRSVADMQSACRSDAVAAEEALQKSITSVLIAASLTLEKPRSAAVRLAMDDLLEAIKGTRLATMNEAVAVTTDLVVIGGTKQDKCLAIAAAAHGSLTAKAPMAVVAAPAATIAAPLQIAAPPPSARRYSFGDSGHVAVHDITTVKHRGKKRKIV